MAFNFKWSPLAADTSFYQRAKELLTTALNKSPKPPIIVDDILVNELNLGEIPPDLEVLEIGDLDVDRFRGMFKMCYNGNAFLTLKTKVQANPLNTYLSTKPSFTSPKPLAAASGLTIPIQITLSDIKLSAFIILVYSNHKGITLVFRNDPLESLKVSSTFDAIPFVRDYLQKEIEGQLRTLLMDELPLIIHRLSLRFFNQEYQNSDSQQELELGTEEKAVDPLSSPPQDPVDSTGNIIDLSQISSLSLEPGSESHALFSQRNLLRLGALTQSHRTLSLFTPTLRDTVFRASANSFDRNDIGRSSSKPTPAISRSQSYVGNPGTTYTFSSSPIEPHFSKSSVASSSTASSAGLPRTTKAGGRRRKHRVVNLRKKATDGIDEVGSVSGESTTNSATGSEGAASAPAMIEARPTTPEMKEPGDTDVGQTPPRWKDATPQKAPKEFSFPDPDETPRQSQYLPRAGTEASSGSQSARRPVLIRSQTLRPSHPPTAGEVSSLVHDKPLKQLDPSPFAESTQTQPAFEQSAWMSRIADEILRKVHERKAEDARFWDRRGSGASGIEDPPPAYGS